MNAFEMTGGDLLADCMFALPPPPPKTETTWLFIRLIEHWNANEFWRPFSYKGIEGEVSSFANIRNCKYELSPRKCYRGSLRDGTVRYEFRNCVLANHYYPVYWSHIVLGTFYPNPRPDVYNMRDHIDRDTTNDRFSNLRWSNAQLNALNKGMFGVEHYRTTKMDRYRASVRLRAEWSGKSERICLGSYNTYEEAKDMYLRGIKAAFEVLDRE